MQLTDNFTLEEIWCHASTPDAVQTRTCEMLARMILQPLRNQMKLPIKITSGFRSAQAEGGAKNSEHFYINGEGAVDINISTPAPKINLTAFNWLATNCLYSIGQLIWYTETTHLHISLAGKRHQGELLMCTSKAAGAYKRITRASEIQPIDSRLKI